MIPHMCKIKHDPPHSYGDCLRACIATLLSATTLEEVPHFVHDGNDILGDQRFKAYLAECGYRPFYMAMSIKNNLDDIFSMMSEVNTDIPYLLFHNTGHDQDHVVICKNDQVIHNPAWYKETIKGPSKSAGDMWVIVVLTPLLK